MADGHGSCVRLRRMDSSWKMWRISHHPLKTFGTHKASSPSSIVGCPSTLYSFVRFHQIDLGLCESGTQASHFLSDTVYYYQASWAMSKMNLKNRFVEHMAVGLMTVLIDMPYDIVSIKYVHWVWHDTDPNICEYFDCAVDLSCNRKFAVSQFQTVFTDNKR